MPQRNFRCRSMPCRAADDVNPFEEEQRNADRSSARIANMLDRVELSKTKSVKLPDSLEAINDHFYAQCWTDGLPIIPPTPERVERMLSGMPWRNPDDVIGIVPPAMGLATLRNIAVNAVMAGCRPAHPPLFLAAVAAGVGEGDRAAAPPPPRP